MASPDFCPFCGKTDSEVVAAEFEGYKRRVECFSCGATGPLGETEDQAVELWNGPRHTAVLPPPRLVAIRPDEAVQVVAGGPGKIVYQIGDTTTNTHFGQDAADLVGRDTWLGRLLRRTKP